MAASRATRSSATDTGHARDYAAIALAYAKKAAADKKQRQHCKWVRLAAQRHLDDLKRARVAAWGYRFDPWHATVTINGLTTGDKVTLRGASGIPLAAATATGASLALTYQHFPAAVIDVNGTPRFTPNGGVWGGDVYG